MRNYFFSTLLIGMAVLAACSPKSAPSKSEPPPVPKTTYVGHVQALIQAKCSPCHIPSKGGKKADFDNYASALKFGAEMVARVEKEPTVRGFMPFKGTKLSVDEIAVFKKWVSDGMMEK
ncbi:MAG: hypothetical protein IPI66_13600 [Chitinophagaceae bacterium]|nr:hypothetical protein [Chitinophagaceae bacterium]MBL0056772.1 hypothetical protein [Chitinophagaceae bacterium]